MAVILGAGEGYSYFLGCLAEPRYCSPLQGPWLEQVPMSVSTLHSPTMCLLPLLMAIGGGVEVSAAEFYLAPAPSCSAVGEPGAVVTVILASPHQARDVPGTVPRD